MGNRRGIHLEGAKGGVKGAKASQIHDRPQIPSHPGSATGSGSRAGAKVRRPASGRRRPGALKARPDGTVLDGHHRLVVLRERGMSIDTLPREVVAHEVTE
jgi:hypothetical protein